MDGIAAAGALTASVAREELPSARPGGSLEYAVRLADREDDPEIRALLRGASFAGDVRLSLEREPDSFLGGSIEGDVHHTIVARHRSSGALAGTASRSVRDAFLNGRRARLGYLGQLRIDPRFRRRRGLLAAGFDFCRPLSGPERVPVYLASVVAENHAARRLLARRAAGWPSFDAVDTLISLAIPVRRRAPRTRRSDVVLQPGSRQLLDEIVACLDRSGPCGQFSPRWTASDLTSPSRTRGLELEDFVVATRGGRVVGCAACWDQRAFKQVIVRGYSTALDRWRPIVNFVSPITGTPRLPEVGAELRFAYVSHLAADPDQDAGDLVDVVVGLVEGVCRRALTKNVDYVVLGLSARCRELGAIKRAFRHRAYESVLYVAFWPEGEACARSLDGRPSAPELAIL